MALNLEADFGTPLKDGPLVSLTIDGVRVQAPRGTSVMAAAAKAGTQIPKLCATDSLEAFGSCRLCLVEIEGRRGAPASCTTPVEQGMVVRTQTDKVKATQAAVLEFILLNHPVDCPVCDQAGECVLQEHYITYSAKPSRLMQMLLMENIAAKNNRLVLNETDAGGKAQLYLSGSLLEFGLDESASEAVVVYDAVKINRGQTVEKKRFESRKPVTAIDAREAGRALNAAANDVAGQISAWVG